MDFKRLSVAFAMALAFSMPAMAQDDDDEGWATAPSAQSSGDDQSYDGSTDSEFANDEEYASAYARYKAETTKKSEINRMRNEGFQRAVLLGIRAQGGINTFFGENSDGWKIGYQDMDAYTNEASIDLFMFEIPIIFRYTFEDYDFYVGLGINMGLKLNGSSEFKTSGGKRDNTVATSGMEVGGAFDIGYMLTRWVSVDIRVVQCFTSLLNKTLVAEEAFYDSSLNTFYTTLGINFMF